MPLWAKDLLLAQISRVPRAALLARPDPARVRRAIGPCEAPGLPGGPGGSKRKREPEEAGGECPAVPTPPPPMESEEGSALSPISGAGAAEGTPRSVKGLAYWASAERGNGVAMRIVERAADTAVDPSTDGDGDYIFSAYC